MFSFDRILIEIMDWIRRLRFRHQADHPILARVIERKTEVNNQFFNQPIPGVLCLVHRDTKRAVKTWIFMPRRRNTPRHRQFDIHVCLDTLTRLPRETGEPGIMDVKVERSKGNTHKITIIKASHFPGPNGEFYGDVLYTAYFDFFDISLSRLSERWAENVIDAIAYSVPFNWDNPEFDWHTEARTYRQIYRSLNSPSP